MPSSDTTWCSLYSSTRAARSVATRGAPAATSLTLYRPDGHPLAWSDGPAEDLPIERASQFDLALNQATARTLGVTFPPSLLIRADEVID